MTDVTDVTDAAELAGLAGPTEPEPQRGDEGGGPPLPGFIVIGAQRSATRWLRTNLDDHPDIYVPDRPIDYFSGRIGELSRRGYRLSFRDAGDAAFVGESSPGYLLRRNSPARVASRIDSAIPDVRLIAILRDPVERMYSAFRDHVIHGRLPLESDLMTMVLQRDPEVEALDLVGGSMYAENLVPYRRRFGERLLVLVLDDIRADPATAYEQVLAHIGAPIGFVPRRLTWPLYSNAHSRWTAGSEPDLEARRLLYMLFRRDVEELEAMMGRYLPEWDPGPPPIDWADRLMLDDA